MDWQLCFENPHEASEEITRLKEENEALRRDAEQLKAVAEYIEQVKFVQKVAPDEPVSQIFACGCLGPMPECRCVKRHRLVTEFLASMKESV